MIERYTLPRMARVWSEENKFEKMLEIEILSCEALCKLKIIPKADLFQIKKKARFNIERIKEIEKKTNHDVISFVMSISESVGDAAKYIHFGLTSSDVVDTAFSVIMCEAADILIKDAQLLLKAFRIKARKYKNTVMIGRSHGIHAEPMTFGLKCALFYEETKRNIDRLEKARETVAYGKISGSVGTYANIDPFVEEYVCRRLGLKPAKVSSQILQRDRHAQYLNSIAIAGTSLEKFSTEFRALQRTEIGEVEEYFSPTQKGSSSMPHKKNPIMFERICGMARILRANALASMENMPLWHERDISHSSVERVIIPDSTIILDYALTKMADLVNRLTVNEDRMTENLNRTKGIIFSQRVLLELIKRGLTRMEAYDIVQDAALNMQKEDINFKEALKRNKKIRGVMGPDAIDGCFDLGYHTKHVDRIFRKVGI
ncbi:MAG: adenylosuccinate lyase [Omnitrophica bacterium RBG_13_46_9]|nr:MAG: adenylosuccinate lyase [Omnitrophica bacterium RBG_13_46_9]